MNSGIYQLTINNKPYIGCANNFTERWETHRSQLKHGKHHSKKLQEAYDTYGDFTTHVVQEADENLITLEKYYIKLLDSKDNGYNMTIGGQGGDTYQFQTPEAIIERNRKISVSVSKAQTGTKRPWASQPGSKNGRYRSDISDTYLTTLREQGLSWRQIGKQVGMSHVGAKNRIFKTKQTNDRQKEKRKRDSMAGVTKEVMAYNKSLFDQGLKKCYSCNEIKPFDDFGNDKTNWTGKMSRCKPCNDIHTRKITDSKRADLNILKEAQGCMRCGYNEDGGKLHFHHRVPSTKLFGIGQGLAYGPKKLQEEIDKCDLLCASCHRTVHGSPKSPAALVG